MAVKLSKTALDAGIIATKGKEMVDFYRNVLGLAQDDDITIPGYGTIHRFNCGESILRISMLEGETENVAGGEFASRNGLRYITLNIDNLEEVVADCKKFGCAVPVDIRDLRPGVRCAQVQDPDGNHVEFISTSL